METVAEMVKKKGDIDFEHLPSQRSMMMKRTVVLEEGMQRLEMALANLSMRPSTGKPLTPPRVATPALPAAAQEQLAAMVKRMEELEAALAENGAADEKRGEMLDQESEEVSKMAEKIKSKEMASLEEVMVLKEKQGEQGEQLDALAQRNLGLNDRCSKLDEAVEEVNKQIAAMHEVHAETEAELERQRHNLRSLQAELPDPADGEDEEEAELTEADFPELNKMVARLGTFHQGVSNVADDEGQAAALTSIPDMQKTLFDLDAVSFGEYGKGLGRPLVPSDASSTPLTTRFSRHPPSPPLTVELHGPSRQDRRVH